MRNRQVNHARNLWDRAVTILPRVSQFWYKYTYMEEMLENVAGARQVYLQYSSWELIFTSKYNSQFYFIEIHECKIFLV